MRIFERCYFGFVLKLEISYRVMIISWRILVAFRGFFEDYIFAQWNIWVSIILSFALVLFNVNGKATVWHTPCFNMTFLVTNCDWDLSFHHHCCADLWFCYITFSSGFWKFVKNRCNSTGGWGYVLWFVENNWSKVHLTKSYPPVGFFLSERENHTTLFYKVLAAGCNYNSTNQSVP